MVRVSNDLPAGCKVIGLAVRGDERGSLIALEEATGVPFNIARVYYIFGTKSGVVRGLHAHRSLIQWAICVAGACTLVVDDGSVRTEVRLGAPNAALEIGPMIWREMRDFTPDAVLLVLASAPYDDADYIRDYVQFIELVRA
jgi:dTDP-4-dehydrorhamnose 3,5-epimerase-like enzyme